MSMNTEIEWKDVIGYEGLYRVNNHGEIYSLISNRILKQFLRGSREDNKYFVVDLHKDKNGKTISVHRIVAEAFIPNVDNLPCVNHKDGNKYNNNVNNLEWCTYSMNNYHALESGLKVISSGTKSKLSKLTYDDVVEIKKCLILGDPNYGTRPLSRKYGVDHNVIMDIYNNVKYTNVKIPYTFFVCSDIHSAYTPWTDALNKAGFNPNKYNHKIIVCGDLFDRMDESLQVYDFVKNMLEKDKLIYVRGNHESLMEECIERGYAANHDWHNGTSKSIIDLAPNAEKFYDACAVVYEKMKPLWNKAVNYFETKNYIFAHGWIPLICKDNLPAYYTRNRKFEFNPDWRAAHASEWEQAIWLNGIDMARNGFVEPGKTIVCGHWHCSYGHMLDSIKTDNWISEFEDDAIWEPYYNDGIIAIDRCTAHTGKVNVLVLEDEFIEE